MEEEQSAPRPRGVNHRTIVRQRALEVLAPFALQIAAWQKRVAYLGGIAGSHVLPEAARHTAIEELARLRGSVAERRLELDAAIDGEDLGGYELDQKRAYSQLETSLAAIVKRQG